MLDEWNRGQEEEARVAVQIDRACDRLGSHPDSVQSSTTSPSASTPAPTSQPSAAPTTSAVASATAAPPQGDKFKGINVNILTFNGPQVAEPLQRRAPDWEQLTGGHVNVVAVGFQTIYDKALLDASTGTNAFDAYVFDPQWMGDFVGPGYLLDLTDRVNNDPQLDWQDVGPFFRDFNATYNGKVYTIPLDGDFHMVYYRKDILDKDGLKPPATWDDYLTIAQKYNGQDLNGDGQPDYGSCIAKKKGAQSYWWIISVAGGLLQSQGHQPGRVLRHHGHDPAVRSERGDDQGPRDLRQDGRVRPAGRAQPWTSAARAACSRPVAAR